MDHDQLDFPQAVEELAKRAGMEVPREDSGRKHKPRQPVDSPLYPLLAAAADYYRQALKSHPTRKAAVEYLKGRGLSGVIARDFGLGFAPPGWDNLMKHLGGDALQQKALIDAGLLIENAENGKRYDRFRDRVMFPIRDSRGRVIAFGGRVLGDDKPKYLNSPETPVFHKGQELYGLYEARQANRDLDEIWWSRATWTSLPWPSKVCAMPSPPWAPPPARNTSNACSASFPACCSASTGTPPDARLPGAHWRQP